MNFANFVVYFVFASVSASNRQTSLRPWLLTTPAARTIRTTRTIGTTSISFR